MDHIPAGSFTFRPGTFRVEAHSLTGKRLEIPSFRAKRPSEISAKLRQFGRVELVGAWAGDRITFRLHRHGAAYDVTVERAEKVR